MKDAARATTARERDRALRRLQSITTGTAVIATLATAGFGTLAALTWSGATTDNPDAAEDSGTINATVAQLDPDNDGDVDATATPDSITSGSTTPGATARPIQPTPTPLATSKRKSRVSSGGS